MWTWGSDDHFIPHHWLWFLRKAASSQDCRWASGCVVECWICNREVAGSNLSLGYFPPRSTQPSIPPGSVNEYQLRLGRQWQVWLIPIADERVGVQVKLKSLENTCHTWALLWWWFTTKRRCVKCAYLYVYLYQNVWLDRHTWHVWSQSVNDAVNGTLVSQ